MHFLSGVLSFILLLVAAVAASAQAESARPGYLEGFRVGVVRSESYRQILSEPGLGGAARDYLFRSKDTYLIAVQVGEETYIGSFDVKMVGKLVGFQPEDWPTGQRVEVRFRKGGKTRARMDVRGVARGRLPTELVSVYGPDRRERCTTRKGRPDCSVAVVIPQAGP